MSPPLGSLPQPPPAKLAAPSPWCSRSISHGASQRLVYGSDSAWLSSLRAELSYLFSVHRERLKECEKVEGGREEGRKEAERRKEDRKEGRNKSSKDIGGQFIHSSLHSLIKQISTEFPSGPILGTEDAMSKLE